MFNILADVADEVTTALQGAESALTAFVVVGLGIIIPMVLYRIAQRVLRQS